MAIDDKILKEKVDACLAKTSTKDFADGTSCGNLLKERKGKFYGYPLESKLKSLKKAEEDAKAAKAK